MTSESKTPFASKQRLTVLPERSRILAELRRDGTVTADQRRTVVEALEAEAMGYVFTWGVITEYPAERHVPSAKSNPSTVWSLFPTTYIMHAAISLHRFFNDPRSPFRAVALERIKKACGSLVAEEPYDGFIPLAVRFADANRSKVEGHFQTAILPQMDKIIGRSCCLLMDEESFGIVHAASLGAFIHEPGHA